MENLDEIKPDFRLDLEGEPCPYPAIRTLEVLPELKSGEILEVISDCPQSINNIPLDAKNHGYIVLKVEQLGPTIRYLIKKP
ncbi:MAG: sulfurtransferase-like selenium metabolism protein YedF [Helicobacteraceae bacterium]|nr:sulfurtransferase-like selenium metabolism protein YedF [Helicobacteraceae bacterium]